MYIKVHKENNQWFRNDNGTLVGSEIPPGRFKESVKILYGDHLVVKNNNNYIIIYYGYLNGKGTFYRFCNKISCISCKKTDKILFCPKSNGNPYKNLGGFYIKTS